MSGDCGVNEWTKELSAYKLDKLIAFQEISQAEHQWRAI